MRYCFSTVVLWMIHASSFFCKTQLIAQSGAPEKDRPSFILLLTDDQSYHLSLIGTPGIKTPNLDLLANNGMFFTKAYAAAASCSPSRSVILTGMYPHSNGHWRNTYGPGLGDTNVQFSRQSTVADSVGVHDDLPTLIEILSANGYITGITNKFHLSPPWKFPFQYRYPNGNTDAYQRTAQFIKQAEGESFFLQANIGYTHRPFRKNISETGLPKVSPDDVLIPPNWPDTKNTREDYADYLSAVEQADDVIGQILRALAESGRANNTIVIYTSDQGFCYHRAKATTYDWGVHIPLSFTGQGIISGIQTSELVSHIDILPTVLDFAGIDIPATVQGVSLRSLLAGETTTTGRDFIFSEHNAHGPDPVEYYPTRTVTDGRYRYIRNLRSQHVPDYPIERFVTDKVFANTDKGLAWLPLDATPGGAWDNRAFAEIILNKEQFPIQYELLKATFFRPKEELYDLKSDPYEMKNLADNSEYKTTREKLSRALDDWMMQTGDDGDPRSHPRRISH